MWHPHEARPRAFALLLLIALLAWSRGPRPAGAATVPISGGCLLGFGATYSVGGAGRTHLGADLGGASGAEVGAPVDGTVVFAGQVPATDGSGSRATCVTVASGGDRWTLLPLDSVEVEQGQSVEEGAVVGRLAGSGDGSSPGTHLHVGLRRGEVYLDPMSLLSALTVAGPSGGGADARPGDGSRDQGESDEGPPGTGPAGADAAAGAPVGSAEPIRRTAAHPARSTAKSSAVSAGVSGRRTRLKATASPHRARAASSADASPFLPITATAEAVRLAAVIALSACAAAALAAGAVSVRRSILEERQEAVEARAGP